MERRRKGRNISYFPHRKTKTPNGGFESVVLHFLGIGNSAILAIR
jgi:hypothetical protein